MWFTAILLGAAGSLHCLGMCSPLAMAVTSIRQPFFVNRLLYNLGRIFTYGVLGMIMSGFGSLFSLSGFQSILSVLMGVVLIFLGIAGVSSVRVSCITKAMTKMTTKLKNLFSFFLKKKTRGAITLMGMLNGLLPCGLTYLALSYCVTLPSVSTGFLFMIIFGLGTLPVMLGVTSFLQILVSRFPISFKKLTTHAMIALGVLLIVRAVYIHAPHAPVSEAEIVICR